MEFLSFAAVARQNVDLANENLARSQERFDHFDTVRHTGGMQAEQALASANDQYISALYGHNLSKLQLARALGVPSANLPRCLGAPWRLRIAFRCNRVPTIMAASLLSFAFGGG